METKTVNKPRSGPTKFSMPLPLFNPRSGKKIPPESGKNLGLTTKPRRDSAHLNLQAYIDGHLELPKPVTVSQTSQLLCNIDFRRNIELVDQRKHKMREKVCTDYK